MTSEPSGPTETKIKVTRWYQRASSIAVIIAGLISGLGIFFGNIVSIGDTVSKLLFPTSSTDVEIRSLTYGQEWPVGPPIWAEYVLEKKSIGLIKNCRPRLHPYGNQIVVAGTEHGEPDTFDLDRSAYQEEEYTEFEWDPDDVTEGAFIDMTCDKVVTNRLELRGRPSKDPDNDPNASKDPDNDADSSKDPAQSKDPGNWMSEALKGAMKRD
jgi:hypothetical protein